MKTEDIRKFLFENRDLKYKSFTEKLVPNIDPETIIGVRMPILRKLAKDLENPRDFIKDLPHKYFEENNLHGYIIGAEKDFDLFKEDLERFLPYIDNWSTCDLLSPLAFKKNRKRAYNYLMDLIDREDDFVKRFAIVSFLEFFVKEEFTEESFYKVVSIKSDAYYVNMAIAWYMSYVLIYHYDFAEEFLRKKTLDKDLHNKSIQKALESRRIDENKKLILRTLKQ
ncbi:DNA alkylation repair protein [Peptoniphilus catoniae]|uniref:DNA alkylation repair protein n=1 Tax=Peptoniphilus catoniae TaxID=1660341 RepID=UPI0010FEAEC4|nr:DNA alkylation repair protein [Peptoniphilus catoniae]